MVTFIGRAVNLIGVRFGRLTVVKREADKSPGNPRWLCLCDCGKTTVTQGGALKGGVQISCGCYQLETATTHGQEGTRAYSAWAAMKSRCLNPKTKPYKDYGGRGIKVCDSWLRFENFYADMGDAPDGMSLDRKDNESGYSLENCRWVSMEVQNNNRRNNHILTFKGKSQSLALWAKKYGISPISLKSRINRGWDVEKSLLTPIDKRYSSRKVKK